MKNLAKKKLTLFPLNPMQKKGVSPVVAEILLVLLTIAAVAIVGTALVKFVGPTLTKSTECVLYKDYFTFKEEVGGVAYNCQDAYYHVGASVTTKSGLKNADKNIIGFNLVFVEGNGNTDVTKVPYISNCEAVNLYGGGQCKAPNPGDTNTYFYTANPTAAGNGFIRAEVYPILSNGDVCDKSDSIDLKPCSQNFNFNS